MIAKKILKNKHFWKKFFVRAVIIIFLLSAVGFLVISNLKMNERRNDLNERIDIYQKEISDLQKENEKIKASISQINNEEGIEKEIRERLGLKKPGKM